MTPPPPPAPWIRELSRTLTSASLVEAFSRRPRSAILDSSLLIEGVGRYSVFGADPFAMLRAKGRVIHLTAGGQTRRTTGNPFAALRRLLTRYSVPAAGGVPFTAGAIGCLGYDLAHEIERLPARARDDLKIPDLAVACYDPLVVHDNLERRTFVVGAGLNPKTERESPEAITDDVHRLLEGGAASGSERRPAGPPAVEATLTREAYLTAVRRIRDYIAAGDVYQVNFAQRFRFSPAPAPSGLFRTLRDRYPSPFGAFLDFGDFAVVSASPERFLKVEGRHVETRPIKGTRPRGKNAADDDRLAKDLLHSAKDNAELAMIVDLERNDLGRVCSYGSVRVTSARELEVHPTVLHLVATVEGELAPRKDAVDLLEATFPGGSVTGAPKIRSMEIIDELEPVSRGVYTGAIGYFGFQGRMDLSVAIRLAVLRERSAWVWVGGGIVADSDPISEYDETLAKGRSLAEAMGVSEWGKTARAAGVRQIPGFGF
ncbi:MAG: aminodeoxychorismate synthase component I [Planctomycetes bacterium]|nr:aminodeoxychorismate synthase component I [Planctomycetota bacterium]